MNTSFEYCVDTELTLKAFSDFICAVSDDFVPPLLGRVDVPSYFEKIHTNAVVVTCSSREKEIIGLCAMYCNNTTQKVAYITLIAVLKGYRGQRIATKLLELSERKAKTLGMKKLGIHTNSNIALQCYLKVGYNIVEHHLLEEHNLVRYYLEKEV